MVNRYLRILQLGNQGLFFFFILSVCQFFIFDVFVEKLIEFFDTQAGGDLSEFVDLDIEALKVLVDLRGAFFRFLLGHKKKV